MHKIGQVAIVVAMVIVAYLLLLVVVPFLTDIVASANATLHATSDMTNYPGTAEAIVGTPWILFFVPGAIGIAAIVIILREYIWRQ